LAAEVGQQTIREISAIRGSKLLVTPLGKEMILARRFAG
jgi:hypothetical protein